jgi:hypothetical protein
MFDAIPTYPAKMPSTLSERALKLNRLQLPWFIGYLIALFASSSYFLSFMLFNSWDADLFYNLHFHGVLLSYSIVAYKVFRKKLRATGSIGVMYCLKDDNVQHISKCL